MTLTFLVFDGPILQCMGRRQTQFYGHQTLAVVPSTLPDSEEA
jgi:3-dehydroquinate dehydratase